MEFGTILKNCVKTIKSTGTRWIAHQPRQMRMILANCDIFTAHIESLSQTDSPALKRSKQKLKV